MPRACLLLPPLLILLAAAGAEAQPAESSPASPDPVEAEPGGADGLAVPPPPGIPDVPPGYATPGRTAAAPAPSAATYPTWQPERPVVPTHRGERHRPANLLTTNPLALLLGFINLEYERRVASALSLFVGPTIFAFGDFFGDDLDLTVFGLDFGLRLYVAGTAPEGFWLSPVGGLAYAHIEDDFGASDSAFGWYAGGMGGYTWIWGGFVLSVGSGLAYQNIDRTYEGVQLHGRASIGAAF